MSPVRPNNHVFSLVAKIYFILLLLLLVMAICIPVTGLMNSGTDITTKVPAIINVTEYETLGKALMAERNWSGVITITNEGLVSYPYNPELLCLQAYAMRKTGHYQEAADLVSLAIPNDTQAVRYANRGYALLAMGKNQDAINDADSALALNSAYTTAYALKAFALRNTGNLSAAEETIDKAITIDPKNPHYLHIQGGILADRGNCTGAIDAYRHSININPEYDLPWPGLTNATADLEKTEVLCAAKGIQASPTKAAFPVGSLFSAGILAIVIIARRAG
ncbi:MAG: tetratricopeptide repeat protein [Methanomicrobiales archaeon]|nr:tetratricopeptide repeat protein [Methanomicrobiales archaeon]